VGWRRPRSAAEASDRHSEPFGSEHSTARTPACRPRSTRDFEQIAREILDDAADVDAAEAEQFGARRGDAVPPAVSTREGRQRWLRAARRRLDQQRAEEARLIPPGLTYRIEADGAVLSASRGRRSADDGSGPALTASSG
jgi:hypothetical protein